jgi:hypothetical protein
MNAAAREPRARLSLHRETRVLLDAPPAQAFAWLDDFRALSAHMEKRSPMMLGSRMRLATDALGGRAVGSRVRMEGRMLGMGLSLEEVVVEREPPTRKAWRTVAARLLVIGDYELGFAITPQDAKSELQVFIDYELPSGWAGRLLGRWLGARYARWCVETMARDAERHFGAATRG